ncbi:ferredoxin [Mycolicibacterium diernhoferi]|nr:ferredoxin [Mycolicibacterium diernhoferi]OJZ67196.1 hypothetical protein BRW64_08205 [Mycolicibacterium diernhoferi]
MRLKVYSEHCMANGSCQRAAPEVFGSTAEGWVVLMDENPSAELRESVVRAADSCPMGAIVIDDGPDQ